MATQPLLPASGPAGLLLIGHGTRHAGGQAELLETAGMIARQLPDAVVQPCFLEIAEPNIADAVARLADSGATRVTAAPLLLFAAGHWKRDVPAELDRVARQHPHLQIRLARHLGNHPALIQLSVQRFNEAIATHSATVAPVETTLVLVGRGSGDQTATDEMIEFTRIRAPLSHVANHTTCFLAMAKPSVSATFESIRAAGSRFVVVQPHLLFQGELFEDLRAQVDQANQASPGQQWLIANPLGPAHQLVRAIIDRCGWE